MCIRLVPRDALAGAAREAEPDRAHDGVVAETDRPPVGIGFGEAVESLQPESIRETLHEGSRGLHELRRGRHLGPNRLLSQNGYGMVARFYMLRCRNLKTQAAAVIPRELHETLTRTQSPMVNMLHSLLQLVSRCCLDYMK